MTFVRHAVGADHPIRSIALNPSGGILADAVGMELLNRGYNVLDTQETSNLLVRMDASEVEWMEPAQLSKMRERNIDAILIVRTASNSDGLPVSASARLVSTQSGRVIGGVAWENAKGGAGGSPLDHMVKKGVTGAAKDMDAIFKILFPE